VAELSRLPGVCTDVWDWQLLGACRGDDPDLFFHPEGERGAARRARDDAAKAVCARCPVIMECALHAMKVQEPYGVWGGMSEEEREEDRRLSEGAFAYAEVPVTSSSTMDPRAALDRRYDDSGDVSAEVSGEVPAGLSGADVVSSRVSAGVSADEAVAGHADRAETTTDPAAQGDPVRRGDLAETITAELRRTPTRRRAVRRPRNSRSKASAGLACPRRSVP
jgi:WhiB family redox-sensing transcriptional regulator